MGWWDPLAPPGCRGPGGRSPPSGHYWSPTGPFVGPEGDMVHAKSQQEAIAALKAEATAAEAARARVAAAAHVDLHDTYWIGRVDNFFEGTIDEVGFYAAALSSGDVGLLFSAGANLGTQATYLFAGNADDAVQSQGVEIQEIDDQNNSSNDNITSIGNTSNEIAGSEEEVQRIQSRIEEIEKNIQTSDHSYTLYIFHYVNTL